MTPVFSAMKWLSVIFVLASLPVFSQKNKTDFSEIDRRVQFVDAAAPFLLAQQLTAECTTDLQKVRAIFRWITDNIAYRTKETVSRKKKSRLIPRRRLTIQPCSNPWMKEWPRQYWPIKWRSAMVMPGYLKLYVTMPVCRRK